MLLNIDLEAAFLAANLSRRLLSEWGVTKVQCDGLFHCLISSVNDICPPPSYCDPSWPEVIHRHVFVVQRRRRTSLGKTPSFVVTYADLKWIRVQLDTCSTTGEDFPPENSMHGPPAFLKSAYSRDRLHNKWRPVCPMSDKRTRYINERLHERPDYSKQGLGTMAPVKVDMHNGWCEAASVSHVQVLTLADGVRTANSPYTQTDRQTYPVLADCAPGQSRHHAR